MIFLVLHLYPLLIQQCRPPLYISTNQSQNTLNGCTISGCSATNGGGVYSSNTSQNTLNDCTFYGCNASNGGGVYSYSSSQNTLNDCTFYGCNATANGGGVCLSSYSIATFNQFTGERPFAFFAKLSFLFLKRQDSKRKPSIYGKSSKHHQIYR